MTQTAAAVRKNISEDFVPYELSDLTIISGMRVQNVVTLKLRLGDELVTLHGEGNGPVDALCNALREAVPGIDIRTYSVSAIAEGSDAVGRGSAVIKRGSLSYAAEAEDVNTDIAGAKAIVAALNMLREHEHQSSRI